MYMYEELAMDSQTLRHALGYDEGELYGTPLGMTKESSSPTSPQARRWVVNTHTHATTAANHAAAPQPDATTYLRREGCSVNAGLKKASRRNHTAFTAHMKGSNANPIKKYFLHNASLSGLDNLSRSMMIRSLPGTKAYI